MRALLIIVVAIVLIVVAQQMTKNLPGAPASGSSAGVVQEIATACQKGKGTFEDYLQGLSKSGVAKQSGDILEVDERYWAGLVSDDKVRVAVAAFCQVMTPQGTGTIAVVGLHDGQSKAGVVNGNYQDE